MLPCGKSLSALIRFKNPSSQSPLTFGVVLALAAWLMQLSVFLTPIFAKQISVGFGVCEELAVFSQFSATSSQSLPRHTSSKVDSHEDEMAGMSMADMPDMEMQNPHPAHSASHAAKKSLQHAPLETTKTSPVLASKVATPTLLQPHVVPNHQNHAKCEFCLLLGHTVLPPLHVVITVLLTVLISKITAKAKVADVLFLNQNKNLRPQGRAPPQFIS